MDKKYILVSMEDERSKKIADVLGSKTCKKIIDLLAQKDYSEKEIADKLGIPLNTTEYNLKKLLNAELIEKTKNFFWSKKGKKIEQYRLSNKSIIISPKRKISSEVKNILSIAFVSGVAALVVRQITSAENYSRQHLTQAPSVLTYSESAKDAAVSGAGSALNAAANSSPDFFFLSVQPGVWFFVGACFAIIFFVLLSLKKMKGGK
jgi:DNA-binding transcriptional ArsR family regulator